MGNLCIKRDLSKRDLSKDDLSKDDLSKDDLSKDDVSKYDVSKAKSLLNLVNIKPRKPCSSNCCKK
jgi:hypothetical protein